MQIHGKSGLSLAVTVVALALLVPASLHGQAGDGNLLLTAAELPWRELGGGARMAPLFGDPSVEGEPFSFRLRVPDGFESQPHTHPIAEHMTVLSGRFYVGIGRTFDRAAAVEYGPGSYVVVAADVAAFMFAVGETEVQVHGLGPLVTIPVEGNPPDGP